MFKIDRKLAYILHLPLHYKYFFACVVNSYIHDKLIYKIQFLILLLRHKTVDHVFVLLRFIAHVYETSMQ